MRLRVRQEINSEDKMDFDDEDPATSGENQPTPQTQTELVPKKGSHSVVWKYFGFKQNNEGQSKGICKACFAIVAAPQSNTTNLYQHLNRHHKVQYDEAVQGKKKSESRPTLTTQTSITDTLHKATPYPHNSSRSKEVTDAIAYHLAKDMVMDMVKINLNLVGAKYICISTVVCVGEEIPMHSSYQLTF